MGLDIHVSRNEEPFQVKVSLAGSLDTATAVELEPVVSDLLEGHPSIVVFDLAALSFLSSAGIRILLVARKSVSDRGGSVVMLNMQPQIARVFEIVKALPGFAVFTGREEMDRYLTAMQKKFSASK